MQKHLILLRNHLPRPVMACLVLILTAVINVVATVIVLVPPLRRLVVARMKSSHVEGQPDPEMALRSIPGLQTMRTMWQAFCCNIYDNVKHGQPVVDVQVISLDGKEHKLTDFMKPGRPLVLKFGSCS